MADSHFDSLTRRNALKTLGGAGAVAVAGCTSEGGNGNGTGNGGGLCWAGFPVRGEGGWCVGVVRGSERGYAVPDGRNAGRGWAFPA